MDGVQWKKSYCGLPLFKEVSKSVKHHEICISTLLYFQLDTMAVTAMFGTESCEPTWRLESNPFKLYTGMGRYLSPKRGPQTFIYVWHYPFNHWGTEFWPISKQTHPNKPEVGRGSVSFGVLFQAVWALQRPKVRSTCVFFSKEKRMNNWWIWWQYMGHHLWISVLSVN